MTSTRICSYGGTPEDRSTVSAPLTPDEPGTPDRGRDATNFSYVSWGDVADAPGLRVSTTAAHDPRLG